MALLAMFRATVNSKLFSFNHFQVHFGSIKIYLIFKGAYSRRNYFLDSPTNGGFCGISLEVDEVYYLIGMYNFF